MNCTHIAVWGGWTFYANSTEVMEVRGSFHCHYYGGTNWRPFHFIQFLATVEEFCNAFNVFGGELLIVNLEIGINVRPPIPTEDLFPLLLFHKTKVPGPMEGTDRGTEFRHPSRYRVKAYDKGYQYPEAGNLFRFEVHIDRKAIFHVLGIRTVQDLTNAATWQASRSFLLARFDEVFIHEPTIAVEGLRPAQRALVEQAKDTAFWMGLTPNKRNRKRRSVEGIYAKCARPNLKAILRTMIADETQRTIDPVEGDE
jgi:hypothetical protein